MQNEIEQILKKLFPQSKFIVTPFFNSNFKISYLAGCTEEKIKNILKIEGITNIFIDRIYSDDLLESLVLAWCKRQNIPFNGIYNTFDIHAKIHVIKIVWDLLERTSFLGNYPNIKGYRLTGEIIGEIHEIFKIHWVEEINGIVYKSNIKTR